MGSYRYSRAQFDVGEIEMLRKVFGEKSHASPSPSTTSSVDPQDGLQGVQKVNKGDLFELIKGLPGYGGVKAKDFEYVLEEVGFISGGSVDFDEFVEVRFLFSAGFFFTCLFLINWPLQICGELREVLFFPAPTTKVKLERKRIPVEKSGGGV